MCCRRRQIASGSSSDSLRRRRELGLGHGIDPGEVGLLHDTLGHRQVAGGQRCRHPEAELQRRHLPDQLRPVGGVVRVPATKWRVRQRPRCPEQDRVALRHPRAQVRDDQVALEIWSQRFLGVPIQG